jgi:acyl-coenzyme A synthetase/AMP-(fatty) acid ligase
MLDSIGTTETFLPYLSEIVGEAPVLREVPAFHYTFREQESSPMQEATYTVELSGRAMMLGYFRADQSADKTMQPEVMRTNDLFVRNGEGWRFLSRDSERIKIAGFWVSPQQLETYLIEDPRVLKAAAIPVSTPEGLTRLRAFIVLKGTSWDPESVSQDLMRRIRAELKPHALRPDRVEVVVDLPSTPSGKLRRQEVRAEIDRLRRVATSQR